MPTEIPRFISSRFGKMFVIEHMPDGELPKNWVISLNSGLQSRSGSRRLYVHLARRLAAEGLGVLRVDLPGVGDSDGPAPPTHFDMHNPDDVEIAIEFIKNNYAPESIVLHGLCAGARVALKTAARNADVKGVLAYSTTIFATTPGATRPPEEPEHGVSKASAEYNKGRLIGVIREAKFLRISFWRKHITSGTLLADLSDSFWSCWLLLTRKAPTDYRTWFIQAVTDYVGSRRPVCFIYGERDQICYMEFMDLKLQVDDADIIVIPDGNHTFSTRSQTLQAIDGSCDWLRRHGFLNSLATTM